MKLKDRSFDITFIISFTPIIILEAIAGLPEIRKTCETRKIDVCEDSKYLENRLISHILSNKS